MPYSTQRRRLTIAGILFGLGLGGFFDGIILHQVLQWHHMVSATESYPPDSLENLQINVLADGFFHVATYVFVVAGLITLWRVFDHRPVPWSTKGFIGLMILGFGIFNVVEGTINHQILGIHHVNETVPESQWIYWDIGFLIWGASMIGIGWFLWKSGEREIASLNDEIAVASE
jgi:uncharacterized membrane protein